ncbi:MAG: ComF family protein [bacterium]
MSCEHNLSANEKIVCSACYSKLLGVEDEFMNAEFERKFSSAKIITGFYTPFIFNEESPVKDIIHKLKYEQRFRNGIYLGEKIAEHGRDIIRVWNINLIIPVPLHRTKQAERGYNQSYYIAKGISKPTGIPVSQRSIRRIRYTQSQTKLNILERKENIKGVFKVKDRKIIKGKNILLVDDVITTGATVSECGVTLLNSGANKIYAVSTALAN